MATATVVLGTGGLPARLGPTAVTVGMFDGVHLGHRALLGELVAQARRERLAAVVVTFDRHPLRVLRPDVPLRLLTALRRRVELLAERGADLVLVLPFTRAFSQLSAEAFVADVLAGSLRARRVVVGTNFRFGHGAAGDVGALRELGGPLGLTVDSPKLTRLDGEPVSSTRVRAALEAGSVELATALLARPHFVEGYVERGDGRGHGLGVPTANLHLPRWLAVPANGIYAGHLTAAGVPLAAAVSVGMNPTFGGIERRVEAHVLDADLDLYGRRVALTFEHRLRDELRFDDVDELVAQMQDDLRSTRRVLGLASS